MTLSVAAESVPSTSATIIKSVDSLHTHLSPSVPSHYLTRYIASALLRRGFQGAESGALTEIERLLEHHLHAVFSGSAEYARLAGRGQPNAFDVLKARGEVEYSSVRRMRRESRKRRPVVKLETTTEPPSPPRPETLQDLMSAPTPKPTRGRDMDEDGNMDVDRKPDLSPSNPHRARDTQGNPTSTTAPTGVKPIYGFEGIPSFPPKWTYPPRPMEEVVDDTPHGQITKRSLDFVKLTASERGDIPAELGLVNFKKQRKRVAAV